MSRFSKLLILLFVIASSFGELTIFGDNFEQLCKLFLYLLVPFMAFFVRGKQNNIDKASFKNSDKYLKWLFLLMIVSIFNSYLFKDQPILSSLKVMLPTLCAYSVYFLLRKGQPSVDDMNKMFLVLGGYYIFCIIADAITIPNLLFGSSNFEEERGGFRLRVPGLFWNSFVYFYSIYLYKEKKEKKYLILTLITFVGICALLGRQTMVISMILGALFFFQGKKISSKIRILVISSLVLLFIIPEIPIVKSMVEMQKSINEYNEMKGEEDIRTQDYRFFVFNYPRNIIQYTFGCGAPAKDTAYDKEMKGYIDDYHYVAGDAGWAGFVFYYGFLSTIILIILICICLKYKIPSKYVFVKYQLAFMALCAYAGDTNLSHHIYMIYMLCFYYLEKVKIHKDDTKSNSLLLVRKKSTATTCDKMC